MSGVGINNDWDDTLLIKAYDRSIRLAQEELARRIARATNTKKSNAKLRDDAAPSSTTAIAQPIVCPSNSKQSDEENPSFALGDYARATYDDGVDYEGKIVAIDEERGTCRIRYIGYENEQEVRISDLVPSWGKKARRMQYNRVQQELDPDEAAAAKTYDSSKKTKSHYPTSSNGLPFGAIPPPPPMPPMLGANGENSEHLSAMLMSWYMSGYYTGIYQGMQMAKANAKQKK